MGFSISEIYTILNNNNINQTLNRKKINLEKEIACLVDQLTRLNNFSHENIKGDGFMNYQAAIKIHLSVLLLQEVINSKL